MFNFHRPCLLATESVDAKGRVPRVYRQQDVTTPLEKLPSRPAVADSAIRFKGDTAGAQDAFKQMDAAAGSFDQRMRAATRATVGMNAGSGKSHSAPALPP